MSADAIRIAFYDLDGTLCPGNIAQRYLFFAARHGPWAEVVWRVARLAAMAPRLYQAERRSRGLFNRLLFREYRGLRIDRLRQLQPDLVGRISRSIYVDAREQLRASRSAGQRLVLLTGELDLAVEPLARELGFDEVLANSLELVDGRATGELAGALIAEEGKAREAMSLCRRHGLEPSQAAAYADSMADLPLLQAVGQPHAVNPDARLRLVARERGWPVLEWRSRA